MHQPISRKVELYKPRNGEAGTETCRVVKPSSVKTKEPPSPCGFTYGIAVYGPVCTVVWEGRAGNRSPYPDSNSGNNIDDIGQHVLDPRYKLTRLSAPREHHEIKVAPKVLDTYVGHYELAPDVVVEI